MLDDNRILECPACHKRLEKVELKSVGITLDICLNGCGGIYFGNKEMPIVMSSSEAIDEIKKICEGKEFRKVDETETRECPFCASNMVKNYTSYSKEVQVDECYRCGGKFLDGGELEKIKIQDTENDTNAIMREVHAMFGKELNSINAKSFINSKNTTNNKRASFFINIAEKFFRK